MTATAQDIYTRINSLEGKLRGCLHDLTTLRAHLAATSLPSAIPQFACPECGLKRTPGRIVEHLWNVHDWTADQTHDWLSGTQPATDPDADMATSPTDDNIPL